MEPSSLCNFLALLSMAFCCAIAYPSGAPDTNCDDMVPGHGGSPQNGTSPYMIDVGQTNTYRPNGKVLVTLRGEAIRNPFKGFFIQARDADDKRFGTFKPTSSNTKVVNCDGKPTAETHIGNPEKTNISVEWTAPAKSAGIIIFFVTFVKNTETYYVKAQSSALEPMIITTEPSMTTKMPGSNSNASSLMNAWNISGILVSLILFCKSALSF